jgi:hypothetical protein
VEQAPIRLKNLVRQATEMLKSERVRAPEIDRPFHGGTVEVFPAGEVPGGGSAAAVFRYAAQAHQAVPAAATGALAHRMGQQSGRS